jgi:hypothetical protein
LERCFQNISLFLNIRRKNMLKKLSTIPFSGTAEQEAALNSVIEKYKGDKSRLMAVM